MNITCKKLYCQVFHPDVLSLFFFTREYCREEASWIAEAKENKEGMPTEKGGKWGLLSINESFKKENTLRTNL